MGEQMALTSKEAASLLGISLQTLDRAVKRGEIPVVRIDRKRRFEPDDLRAWLRRHKAPWTKKGAME